VKKQKDKTHTNPNFQEAQKPDDYCEKQIHIETLGEFQKAPKIVLFFVTLNIFIISLHFEDTT